VKLTLSCNEAKFVALYLTLRIFVWLDSEPSPGSMRLVRV